jgi:hypothetical protein
VAQAGDDPREVWRAACSAIRTWAVGHPHEYALIYGSPVPGYAAPEDTIGPATAVYQTLVEPLRRSSRPGRRGLATDLPPGVEADATRLAAELDLDVAPERIVRLLGALTQVFGIVSFELFGHTQNVIEDHEGFFADRIEALAEDLGL